MSFRVQPPERSPHRPADTYDVVSGFGETVIDNLTYDAAQEVAQALSEIGESAWRNGYYTGKHDYAASITGGQPISTPNPSTQDYDEFDRWLNQVKADAWDEGYARGTRDAEQDTEPADNPYRSTL